MIEKINKIISESLPEATANEMKKFIEQAEKWREEVKESHLVIEDLRNVMRDQRKEIDKLKALRLNAEEIEQAKIEVAGMRLTLLDEQRALDMTVLQAENNALERERETVIKLVNKVFGHPNVTVSTHKEHVFPKEDYSTVHIQREYTTDTTITDQTKK